jgi:hypothetical protein
MPGIFDCQPAKCLTAGCFCALRVTSLSLSVGGGKNVSRGLSPERNGARGTESAFHQEKQRAATRAARVPIAMLGLP